MFDYYVDPETKKFELWSKKVPRFELDVEVPLQVQCIRITETMHLLNRTEMFLKKKIISHCELIFTFDQIGFEVFVIHELYHRPQWCTRPRQ